MSTLTTTALKRWSCIDVNPPKTQDIKYLHVYDFDNTLFSSPLPSKQLWHTSTIGPLQQPDIFCNGGWWHDSRILADTGEGIEKEEPRAWRGWWNEEIVSLVELTMSEPDALAVLITGRSESRFTDLIKRIVASRNLKFDLMCLKPEVGPSNQKFASTMAFKQAFLDDLLNTYRDAREIRIYEDRPSHVTGFQEYLDKFNDKLRLDPNAPRKPIDGHVIEVAPENTTLDPVTEVAEVQRMINAHNTAYRNGELKGKAVPWRIERSVFFTGYMISEPDAKRLIGLATIPSGLPHGEIRYLGSSIVITPRPCPPSIMNKVGGAGKNLRWRAIATGCFQNKVWAVKVEPVVRGERYHTENHVPLVVLALRRTARPVEANRIHDWHALPQDKAFEFDSVVGEKVSLRLEEERPADRAGTLSTLNGAGRAPNMDASSKAAKRPLTDEAFPPLGTVPTAPRIRQDHTDEHRWFSGGGPQRGFNQQRGGRRDQRQDHRVASGGNQRFGRGGAPRGAGPASRGRGRGGFVGYRSLDDEEAYNTNSRADGGLSY